MIEADGAPVIQLARETAACFAAEVYEEPLPPVPGAAPKAAAEQPEAPAEEDDRPASLPDPAPDPRLAHIDPDEPIFTLRAQDILAADHTRAWARKAAIAGAPDEKVESAYVIANAMDRWKARKIPD